MNKEELLQELAEKMSTGEISREEVITCFHLPSAVPAETVTENSSYFSVTKMLYVAGAAIVIIGIFFFVSQIWEEIGSFGRIMVTLGLGLLLTAMGSMLLKNKSNESIGTVFQFMGGMLIPGGSMVTLYELGDPTGSLWPVAITFGIIFVFYLLLNFVQKNAILTFFAIANGTTFIYTLIGSIIHDASFDSVMDVYAYLTMVVGVSYVLLADAFRNSWNKRLVGLLYFFGSTGFLGSAFSRVFESDLWEILYFFVVMGCLALAVYLRSRVILVMSTIFLIFYIARITEKYFADSLGWPITLVILGFVFIGLGYASVNISKKYIAKS